MLADFLTINCGIYSNFESDWAFLLAIWNKRTEPARNNLLYLIEEVGQQILQATDEEILNMSEEDWADIAKVDEIIRTQIEKARQNDPKSN